MHVEVIFPAGCAMHGQAMAHRKKRQKRVNQHPCLHTSVASISLTHPHAVSKMRCVVER